MASRRVATIVLAVAALMALLQTSAAQGRSSLTVRPDAVSATGDSLTLTIQTPRSAYPPDALVPVTVTLHNRNNSSAAIEECGGFLPAVELLDADSHQVNQPAIPTDVTHPACFDPTVPQPLPVGATETWRGLIILRASRLRAVESIYRPGGGFTAGTDLQTPILQLQTLPPTRTAATIVTTPQLHAVIHAPARARLYYSDRVDCSDTRGAAIYGGSQGWTQAAGNTITPTAVDGCKYITRWRTMLSWELSGKSEQAQGRRSLKGHHSSGASDALRLPEHSRAPLAASLAGS